MRRFRNPPYAPESLERKLSPSGVVHIPVIAEVHVVKAVTPVAKVATPTTQVSATPVKAAVPVVVPVMHAFDDPTTPVKPPTTGGGDPPPSNPPCPNGTGEPI